MLLIRFRPQGLLGSGVTPMGRLLEIQGLTRRFGGVTAVESLDLHVDEGELVSVIGPNGAGKTTSFNLISGLDRADAGSIRFDGRADRAAAPRGVSPRSDSRAPSSTAACSPISASRTTC